MRDGALPAVALCLPLGMLLAYASRRDWLVAAVVVAVAAFAVGAFVLPLEWETAVVIACWSATILFAAGMYLARPLPMQATLLAAALAGVLTGALVGEIGRPGVLAAALPCLLIRVSAAWLVARRRSIVVKVLASWLMAVATLSIGLTAAAGVKMGADHLE